ncbi:hypothetical protein [Terriglobus tenax]|uniref:hypothetical protein n=1 Tax=Terriglobus tenax TaxID=1111115 RepID=UPI0021E08952|nr:hypothetical protein [Terriglobus tenax]
MKKMMIAIVEMLLLFIAAMVGFAMHPFNVERVLRVENGATRVMVYDWILVTAIVWVLLTAVEMGLGRKANKPWLRPTICFAVVVLLGFIAHLGLKTTEVGLYRF